MPRPSRKTPARIARMLALHKAGASAREIGDELDLSHGTVAAWLKDAGLGANGGHGRRSVRARPTPSPAVDAIASATETLAGVSGKPPPADRIGAVAHLRARMAQIAKLGDQLARGLPKGETNANALATVVRLERELAAGIAELTPDAGRDPDTDPSSVETATAVDQKIRGLVAAARRKAVCQACGRNPYGER